MTRKFTRRRLLLGIPMISVRKTHERASRDTDRDRERLAKLFARYGSEIGDIRKVGR